MLTAIVLISFKDRTGPAHCEAGDIMTGANTEEHLNDALVTRGIGKDDPDRMERSNMNSVRWTLSVC